ncbi:MAG: amidohydrolase, partial [Aestuariivirga sp.]
MTDLIIVNGDIRTMDPLQPRVTALAARGKRVVALGDDAEIRALATPSTRVIDAGGRLVLPGFQDTHIHLQESGTRHAFDLDLQGVRNLDELKGKLAAFAAKHPDRAWLKGHGWYTGIFNDRNLTRQVLDEAVPDRPLFLSSSDYHSAVINTRACEAIGLDAGVQDPENGYFSRDALGIPTGMLNEAAMEFARERMPKTTDAEWEEGVLWGQHHANRHGFTGVLDALVTERH